MVKGSRTKKGNVKLVMDPSTARAVREAILQFPENHPTDPVWRELTRLNDEVLCAR